MKNLLLIVLLAVGLHNVNASPVPQDNGDSLDDDSHPLSGTGGDHPASAHGKKASHGVMNVLNTLSSDINMDTIKMILKDHKELSRTFLNLVEMFPLLKYATTELAKLNPEFRVLQKVATGKLPTLTDLFDMATSHRNLWNDYVETVDRIPSVQKAYNIMNQPKPDYKKIVSLLFTPMPGTGSSKTYSASSLSTNPNLLQLVRFFVDNWVNMQKVYFIPLCHTPIDYVQILNGVDNLDYSHFPTSLTGPGTQGKYSVTSPDPDLAQVLHDVRVTYPQILKQGDTTKAKSAVFDYSERLVNIVSRFTDDVTLQGQQLMRR